jgi:uncharacterized protein DUF1799
MLLDDLDRSAFEVWAENLQAIETFIAMSTQWRVGGAGAVGLDYGALPAVLRLRGVPRTAWTDLFEQLQIIESEALTIMSEARSNG